MVSTKASALAHTLAGLAVAALLAACGGSQPPIGAPKPQTSAIAARADRGKSWMLREAKNEELLYAANQHASYGGSVVIFAYPKGNVVGQLTFSGSPSGLCADEAGNVFVTAADTYSQGYVYEYAHAGTQPIATLSDPGAPYGCSVDPTTGNLAVANIATLSHYGFVAVFQDAQGTAKTYNDSDDENPTFCTYDGSGNLFIDGSYGGPDNMIGELPSGSGTFTNITLSESIGPQSLQWNEGSLVTAGTPNDMHGEENVYQIKVSGTSGTVSGPVSLWSLKDRNPGGGIGNWLQANTMIGPDWNRGEMDLINFWRYPKGGKPTKTLHVKGAEFLGVAMSVAR